jgi:peroxiredoxin
VFSVVKKNTININKEEIALLRASQPCLLAMTMKKTIKILLIALFLGLFSLVIYQIFQKIQHKKEVAAHIQQLPNFAFPTINGEIYTQDNIPKNKPIIIVYYNSECDFCNEEAQMIKENIHQLAHTTILFISFETKEKIKTFATQHQLLDYDNITFLHDSKITFATTFDIKGMPCIVLYDKNRNLIEKLNGQTKAAKIIEKLEVP